MNKKVDLEKIAQGVRLILEGIGEDADRDGLKKTPRRVADFYAELTDGMWENAATISKHCRVIRTMKW